jgi:S1-C subfamily serine protease
MTAAQTSALQQFSDDLAAAVERAAPWTVTVDGRRRLAATGVIWSANGLVVTADHVIENEDEISIGLSGGERVKAQMVGRDPGADIAVLRIDGQPAAADISPDGATQVGHIVLALGRPGTNVQASVGIASAIGGPWRSRSGTQVDATLRSDTTFFPGFSGGPLIDVQGRVVGVNSSRFRGGNLTITAGTVSKIVALLQEHGRVRRAYLGVASQAVRLDAASAGQESGLLIVNVEADSPAGRAGLLLGDILTGIEGAPIATAEDLQSHLGAERVGAAVALQLLRGGSRHEVTATLVERP